MSSRGAPSATSCNMLCAVTCNPRGVDGLLTPVPNRKHWDLPPASKGRRRVTLVLSGVARSQPSTVSYALTCEALQSPDYACPTLAFKKCSHRRAPTCSRARCVGDQVLAHALHLALASGHQGRARPTAARTPREEPNSTSPPSPGRHRE
jgi:hypothetical protein